MPDRIPRCQNDEQTLIDWNSNLNGMNCLVSVFIKELFHFTYIARVEYPFCGGDIIIHRFVQVGRMKLSVS